MTSGHGGDTGSNPIGDASHRATAPYPRLQVVRQVESRSREKAECLEVALLDETAPAVHGDLEPYDL